MQIYFRKCQIIITKLARFYFYVSNSRRPSGVTFSWYDRNRCTAYTPIYAPVGADKPCPDKC